MSFFSKVKKAISGAAKHAWNEVTHPQDLIKTTVKGVSNIGHGLDDLVHGHFKQGIGEIAGGIKNVADPGHNIGAAHRLMRPVTEPVNDILAKGIKKATGHNVLGHHPLNFVAQVAAAYATAGMSEGASIAATIGEKATELGAEAAANFAEGGIVNAIEGAAEWVGSQALSGISTIGKYIGEAEDWVGKEIGAANTWATQHIPGLETLENLPSTLEKKAADYFSEAGTKIGQYFNGGTIGNAAQTQTYSPIPGLHGAYDYTTPMTGGNALDTTNLARYNMADAQASMVGQYTGMSRTAQDAMFSGELNSPARLAYWQQQNSQFGSLVSKAALSAPTSAAMNTTASGFLQPGGNAYYNPLMTTSDLLHPGQSIIGKPTPLQPLHEGGWEPLNQDNSNNRRRNNQQQQQEQQNYGSLIAGYMGGGRDQDAFGVKPLNPQNILQAQERTKITAMDGGDNDLELDDFSQEQSFTQPNSANKFFSANKLNTAAQNLLGF